MPPMHQNYSILLDLNASNASELLTATTAAAAVSQELWNLGGALVQRAQEENIPCGESLTSICTPSSNCESHLKQEGRVVFAGAVCRRAALY